MGVSVVRVELVEKLGGKAAKEVVPAQPMLLGCLVG